MRNGRKFNILEVMRFFLSFILAVYLTPCAWAQNTQEPQVPVPIPTVTVEAKVAQIVLNDEHRQGVDWEAIVSDFHTLQLKKEGDAAWFDKKYNLSVGEVSNEDYTVLLDALDTVGHVTQNDYSVVVLNKDESKMEDVSPDPKSLPYIHLDLKWFNSAAGDMKLKVEPTINLVLKDSGSGPVTLKKETEVDLKDNGTVVIGGLISEEEIKKTRKIPLLGDLPLVGLVFRKQGKLMQRTETIIFLTTHTNSIPTPADDQK